MDKQETKKITQWLTSELHKPRGEEKGVRKIELRTAAPGSKGSVIDSVEIDRRWSIEEIPSLADAIMTRAQEDADGNGPNVQRYNVLTYVTGDAKPSGRFVFRLRGDTDLDLDESGDGEYAPTNRGLMTQLMKTNLDLTRGIASMTTTMLSIATRRAESDERNVANLLNERIAMFKELEEARSDNHSRNMEMLLVGGENERKDKAFEKLMQLVPVVMNRLAGGKLLPATTASTDPLMMVLEPLIGSMTAEQFQAIQQTLTPEQTIQFVEVLQTFQKRQAAKNGAQTKEN